MVEVMCDKAEGRAVCIITLLTADSLHVALEMGVPHFCIQEVPILNLSFEVCWHD
jgi:hypothetical protein